MKSEVNKYLITRLSLPELAYFFEKKLNLFVQYKGKEAFKYNLELGKFKNVDALNEQLVTKFGLQLKPSTSSVLMVEIN